MAASISGDKENIAPMAAQLPKDPKPSGIPRLQATPSKDPSYMTPYGLRSPKDSLKNSPGHSQRGTPRASAMNTPQSRRASLLGSPKSASPRGNALPRALLRQDHDDEYDDDLSEEDFEALQKAIKSREEILAELKTSCLTVRTQMQQTELTQQELEESFNILSQTLLIKKNDMEALEQERKAFDAEMERELDLKKKELLIENELAMQEYENQCKAKIDEIISEKKGAINAKKARLQKELDEIDYEINNNQEILEQKLEEINKEHAKKMAESKKGLDLSLQKVIEESNDSKKQLESTKTDVQRAKENHKALEEERDTELSHLNALKDENSQINANMKSLREQIETLKASSASKMETIRRLTQDMQWKLDTKAQLDEDLLHCEDERRKLHNRLQELKGNIRVFCRIRPKIQSEIKEDLLNVQVPDNDEERQEIEITDTKSGLTSSTSSLSQQPPSKKYNFSFDKVFQQDATNHDIFEEISQLVQSALYGFNICIFAYGQTGSGKTFTMSGEDGVIPQTIHQIFESCRKSSQRGWEYTISGEFLEIYNESINDLLVDQSGSTLGDGKKYDIKHDQQSKTTYITNITQIEFSTPDEMNETLQRALNNRSIASTKSNERSSRSHTVCIIRLRGTNTETGKTISSVLNLIDLAGSERIAQSQVSGDRLKETQAINKSLSCLGDVIYALGDENAKHVPFRNSKLTYLLQYSLIEDSKTLMFVNVSPLAKNLSESVNSLRFATKVNSTGLQRKE